MSRHARDAGWPRLRPRLSTTLTLLSLLLACLAGLFPAPDGSTASAASCDPRPPVVVRVNPATGGQLQAHVTAGAGSLRQITVRESVNATVRMSGQTLNRAGETMALAPGIASTTLLISPVAPGQPMTVPLVVSDDCGNWPTFVGGGPDAFSTQTPAPSTPTTTPAPGSPTPTATPTPTTTASPTATAPPSPTALPSPTASPTPIASPTSSPTPAQPTPPASNGPAWEGVPHLTVDYGRDVESWWADHPFNPESPHYAPAIASPPHQVNVRTEHDGNIQAAIDALPPSGGTLYFPAGEYEGGFRLIARSHVHFIGAPGAIIRSATDNKILGCAVAENYGTFGAQVHARVPAALACATTDRIRDVYVKGLTFDGAGAALQGFHIAAAQDIVFDGVTLQNYANPGNHHRGLVSGNASLQNIWFRGVRFVGKERYALYLDGLHGGGVIGSLIENGFSGGGLLFLTNDDFSRDYDNNGVVDLPEQRMSQHVVVYGNTFAGGAYDAVSATGRNLLVKNNTVTGSLVTLAYFQAKSSHIDASLTYEYLNNRVVGNRVRQARQLVEVAAPPNCPMVVNCALAGEYQVRDNIVETAGMFQQMVKEIASSTGQVQGPNVTADNCVGSAACPRGTLPPTTHPEPGAPHFPLGLFEDGNMIYGVVERFDALIADARAHGLDSVMFTNNSVARDEMMLWSSDREGFGVYFAPHHELNSHWFSGAVPATIEAARAIVNPLVDQLKWHPSIRAYVTIDEPGLEARERLALISQAFRERDPNRPAVPLLIGINRAEPLFAASQATTFLADLYPFGQPNPPCTYTMTGFGYDNEDFVSYLRRISANKPADTPLWLVLQTHSFGGAGHYALRPPSPPELRAQQWMAVGEGATGIFWFTYSSQQGWTGLRDAPALFDEVGALARRLAPLRATLLQARPATNQFAVGGIGQPYVSTLASQDGTKQYAVVVNRGACSESAVLTITSSSLNGQLRDLETGDLYALGEGITFAPGDGKVFELVPAGS